MVVKIIYRSDVVDFLKHPISQKVFNIVFFFIRTRFFKLQLYIFMYLRSAWFISVDKFYNNPVLLKWNLTKKYIWKRKTKKIGSKQNDNFIYWFSWCKINFHFTFEIILKCTTEIHKRPLVRQLDVAMILTLHFMH